MSEFSSTIELVRSRFNFEYVFFDSLNSHDCAYSKIFQLALVNIWSMTAKHVWWYLSWGEDGKYPVWDESNNYCVNLRERQYPHLCSISRCTSAGQGLLPFPIQPYRKNELIVPSNFFQFSRIFSFLSNIFQWHKPEVTENMNALGQYTNECNQITSWRKIQVVICTVCLGSISLMRVCNPVIRPLTFIRTEKDFLNDQITFDQTEIDRHFCYFLWNISCLIAHISVEWLFTNFRYQFFLNVVRHSR